MKCQSEKPALALVSFGDVIIVAARESNHFDIGDISEKIASQGMR